MARYILRTTSLAAVAAFGLGIGIGWMSLANASPEEEIARLDRVRQKLFEELVQTRREAASARAELEEMRKARDQAEAELTRLRQESASPRHEAQTTNVPASPDQSGGPLQAARGNDASTQDVTRTNTARPMTATKAPSHSLTSPAPSHRTVRTAASKRETTRPEHVRPSRSTADMSAPAPALPNVLRLQRQ
jgi:TolA-binding protein